MNFFQSTYFGYLLKRNFEYRDIYKMIKKTGVVSSSNEGLKKVLEAKDGRFALIHDSKQVMYRAFIAFSCTYWGRSQTKNLDWLRISRERIVWLNFALQCAGKSKKYSNFSTIGGVHSFRLTL